VETASLSYTNKMPQLFLLGVRTLACVTLLTARALAQAPASSSPAGSSSPVERGIDLAAKGRCEEALPLLKKFTPSVTLKQLKYRALMATVRCALNRREEQTAANALFDFKREFPEDPEVLYMTSEFFLEIAVRASQELAAVAPTSYQTRELQAETLESQNKWGEAAAIYKKILEENPKLRGIHFRLGRAALSQPESPTSAEDAKKEFEQELAIDPVNAAAEFWLGEIARREGQWDDAISHFTSAAKLDSNYAEAFLALGMALNSAGRFPEAIPQLEQFVKMSPEDPAGHYQLSIAYARTGRKEDFVREITLHKQLLEKKQAAANAAPH
jgi:tetratricopeptide (TPR) repeat protein